jgi:hypothetical protein
MKTRELVMVIYLYKFSLTVFAEITYKTLVEIAQPPEEEISDRNLKPYRLSSWIILCLIKAIANRENSNP